MKKKCVQEHSVIDVEYEGRLDDGSLFDTSKEEVAKKGKIYQHSRQYRPLHMTMGAGYVIQGFEQGLRGMEEGEEKEIAIPPEAGYGMPRENWVKTIDRSLVQGKGVKKGDVMVVTIQGQNVPATVVDIAEKQIVLNFNHPLAGRTLHFKMKVVKIYDEKKG